MSKPVIWVKINFLLNCVIKILDQVTGSGRILPLDSDLETAQIEKKAWAGSGISLKKHHLYTKH